MMLGVLMITAMTALAAVPVIAVLRAPLVQVWHRGEPEPLRVTLTATVVPPVQSPRPVPGRPAAPGVAPRIIRGKVER
jgi:hypothetical protein